MRSLRSMSTIAGQMLLFCCYVLRRMMMCPVWPRAFVGLCRGWASGQLRLQLQVQLEGVEEGDGCERCVCVAGRGLSDGDLVTLLWVACLLPAACHDQGCCSTWHGVGHCGLKPRPGTWQYGVATSKTLDKLMHHSTVEGLFHPNGCWRHIELIPLLQGVLVLWLQICRLYLFSHGGAIGHLLSAGGSPWLLYTLDDGGG